MKKGKIFWFNFLIAWLKIHYRNLIDFFSEYVGTWLGLAKIGVVPALINYNLKHKSLVHTVTVAKSKAIIYGVELAQGKNIFLINQNNGLCISKCNVIFFIEIADISLELKNGAVTAFPTYSSGPLEKMTAEVTNTVDLNEVLEKVPHSPVPEKIQNSIGFKDKLLYIYTSGTTGLPKAAVIKHSRYANNIPNIYFG